MDKTEMKTIKLSYTILNAWAKGHQEDAISYYLGKEIPSTPAMDLGKLKHQEWELFAVKNKTLRKELGGDRLINPLIEQKHSLLLDFSDQYQILIRGVIDVEDQDLAIDYKCGKGKCSNYISSFQAPVYKVLRPNLKRFMYICYDPYIKTVERGLYFLSDKVAEDGLNFIYTYGGEIISYLESQKLIIDYVEKEDDKHT
jgi:hypothetical protein